MILKVEDLSFSYSSQEILKNISFEIKQGDIVSLIGSSGSGKTTLFKLISQLILPKSGKIELSGEIVYMQQEDLLLPWRDVLGNLTLLTELKGGNKQEKKAHALLEKVGLKGYEKHYPHELSGGMRQRVSLARALFHIATETSKKPSLLLLDEPFGSLDILIREQLYEELISIAKEQNLTIFFITHDFRDALSLSQRFLLLTCRTIVEATPTTSQSLFIEEIKQKLKIEIT